MASFIGNTATSATSTALNIPCKIISFSLANKTGGAGAVTVGVLKGSTFDILFTYPLTAAGTTGATFIYSGKPIIVPANYQIFVAASVATDYIFSIETF